MKKFSKANGALASAVLASGLAATTPALAGPYITVDILARPAVYDPARYQVADGFGGYEALSGYLPAAPGTVNNVSGFTSIITASSVGEAYEILIRLTMGTQGTVNLFAPGASLQTIVNLNPSSGANRTGMIALNFNLSQSTVGSQLSLVKHNQGRNFQPDPAGDGSESPVYDHQIVMDRLTDAGSSGSWDAGAGSFGGYLQARGNGSYDATQVLLIRPPNTHVGVGGTLNSPTIVPQNAAIAYVTVNSVVGTGLFTMNFDVSNYPEGATSLLAGLRWRNAADTADINFSPTVGQQAASVAGGDPIIKVNGLTIVGSIASAAVSVSAANNSTIGAGSLSVTNSATGAQVDPLLISAVSLTPALANGTWSQSGISAGEIAGNNGSQTGAFGVTFNANTLKGARVLANFQFTAAGKNDIATGQGAYTYLLSADQPFNSAPTGAGTTFGTAQTAAIQASLRSYNLSTTEASSLGTTLAFLDSTSNSGFTQVSAQWRHRSVREETTGYSGFSLISDVANVSLNNISAGSKYVIQMSYDPANLGGATESSAFLADRLYLVRMTPGLDGVNGSNDDVWSKVGTGLPQASRIRAYQFSDFATLGAYGVDTINHTVWAVIPGSMQGQFAVVPEPASLGILAMGALVLLQRKRR